LNVEEKPAESEPSQVLSPWKLITSDDTHVQLSIGTTTVGRAKERGLLIDDPKVSRLHAELHAIKDKLELVDLGSTNGTFVNSERLTPNQPRLLKSGDELLFGSTRFICQE
jgi:pSer/pThr/pTyr-binding forkhead associated (FHA) protein